MAQIPRRKDKGKHKARSGSLWLAPFKLKILKPWLRLNGKSGFRILQPNAKSKSGFDGFSFLPFAWEIRKRIYKTMLVNSGLLFANYACACKTTVLKNFFSNSFSDFPKRRKERKSKNRYLCGKIRFRISRSIANPKSGF